jgi:lipoate-protein ligase B
MIRSICEVHTLGLIDYQEAWDLQNQFAAEIAAGDRLPTLLLLGHPHTYTFGRRGDAANLLWDEAELRQRGIAVHWVDRGGDVTYHGPGQLVGYPLLPLGSPSSQKVDYLGYIRKLEQVIIITLAEFGVSAQQVEGLTGVWITEHHRIKIEDSSPESSIPNLQSPIQKLAAIGVKVDARGISRHGFALNINPDMSYWEGITGCGLPYPEISLAQLLDPLPAMDLIIKTIVEILGDIFGFDIRYVK